MRNCYQMLRRGGTSARQKDHNNLHVCQTWTCIRLWCEARNSNPAKPRGEVSAWNFPNKSSKTKRRSMSSEGRMLEQSCMVMTCASCLCHCFVQLLPRTQHCWFLKPIFSLVGLTFSQKSEHILDHFKNCIPYSIFFIPVLSFKGMKIQ